MTLASGEQNPVGVLQDQLSASLDATPLLIPNPARNSRTKLSRTAHLHLTNRLARAAPTSFIVLLITVALFLFLTHETVSMNVIVWPAMLGLSLFHPMRWCFAYRAGDSRIASRPLRWRANHAAAMSVVGVLIGAGCFMALESTIAVLLPGCTLLVIGTFFAAVLQASYRPAALGLFMPVAIATIMTTVAINLPMVSVAIAAAAISVLTGVILHATRTIKTNAKAQFPRTNILLHTDIIAPLRRVGVQRTNSQPARRTA